MDSFPIERIDPQTLFPQLAEIPEPPKELFIRGNTNIAEGTKLLAVVGSRAYTSYGKFVCRQLIEGLRGYPIIVISGLALGIDAEAHRAAIDTGLQTIAFPGSGLEWKMLYPAQNRGLAEMILESNGTLVSEYKPTERAAIWTFPRRNRLMAGVADMTLVIEAQEKSGTLITARLATEYNKTVGAVPGAINAPTSKGSNWLLRMGAVPITESADIIVELGLSPKATTDFSSTFLTEDEQRILSALSEPKTKDYLMHTLALDPIQANVLFSMLEIKGLIRETMGHIERI